MYCSKQPTVATPLINAKIKTFRVTKELHTLCQGLYHHVWVFFAIITVHYPCCKSWL